MIPLTEALYHSIGFIVLTIGVCCALSFIGTLCHKGE